MIRILSFLLIVLSSQAFAMSVETYQKTIDLDTDNKKQAQKIALNQASRELIIQMLGQKEYSKKKSQIEKKIIKNKNRYVLSISSSSGELQDTGKFRFSVTIKISKNNLRDLLKSSSVVKVSRSSYCIIPLITFSSELEEKNKQTWFWWKLEQSSEESFSTQKKLAETFFRTLSRDFTKLGFYFIDPVFQKTVQAVPESLLPKRSKKMKHFNSLVHFYSCDIILSGSIDIEKNVGKNLSSLNTNHLLKVMIRAFNQKTKESLFELNREFSLGNKDSLQKTMDLKSQEVIESLIYRFSFYKERGSLGLDRLMLALQGPLSYSEKEKFITQIMQKVNGLKNIQIVYLSSQRAIYKSDISNSLDEILKDLKKIKLKDFTFQVRADSNSKLEIYAQTKK